MAAISKTPSISQMIDFARCPANQNPLAALKQRIALVHPLAQAAGLLMVRKMFMECLPVDSDAEIQPRLESEPEGVTANS
jgi:hypothetical protein